MEFGSCWTTGDHAYLNWNTGIKYRYRKLIKNILKKILENDAAD